MDKNKIKKEIASKLKKEMSMTGTGASVTPGVGAGVATKYAFGKRDNKGTPKDWKAAPSIPNRPSKAMDYKELWEGELKLGVKYDYNGDSGFISTGGSNDPKDWKFLGDKGKYPYLSVKADLVPSEKQPGKYDGAFDLGMGKGHHIDEAKEYKVGDVIHFKDGEDWKVMKVKDNINKLVIKPHNEKAKENNTSLEIDIDMDYVKKNINEGYAQFRNETKTRTKPEQFHSAVKEVKKKVNEINRLFEYMNRLQSELSESEGGLKYKKYTEKSIQQIKESTKQLFFKSTKLK